MGIYSHSIQNKQQARPNQFMYFFKDPLIKVHYDLGALDSLPWLKTAPSYNILLLQATQFRLLSPTLGSSQLTINPAPGILMFPSSLDGHVDWLAYTLIQRHMHTTGGIQKLLTSCFVFKVHKIQYWFFNDIFRLIVLIFIFFYQILNESSNTW